MKILVIPDIHQDFAFVDRVLNDCNNADKVIFLGDYFDSFWDSPRVFSFDDSCIRLRHLVLEHLDKDKFVFLVGNHDMSYIYNNNGSHTKSPHMTPDYFCSGVTKSKASKFRKHFFSEGLKDQFFLDNFKLVHREGDWTFSHAGIIRSHIPFGMYANNFLNEVVPETWKEFRNFSFRYNYLLSDVGVCRYGNATNGGILWCDWRYDFIPDDDIGKQVVGHTTLAHPECESRGEPGESHCIDCSQRFYGILEDGKFEYVKAPEREVDDAS